MSIQTQTPISVSDNEYEILRLQKDIGTEIIFNIKDFLRDQGIDFTGDLSNSFQLVMINGEASVETGNAYASIVDKGMSGGNIVNFDALKDWVRIKIGLEEPELTPVTWKIVNKIQNEGIKPTRFVKKSLKRLIGEHGVSSVKRTGGGRRKSNRLNKILKFVRKVKKTLNKASKNINKVYKPINRYK